MNWQSSRDGLCYDLKIFFFYCTMSSIERTNFGILLGYSHYWPKLPSYGKNEVI